MSPECSLITPLSPCSTFAVCILAETEGIKAVLKKENIDVETVAEVYPIRVQPARILSHIYARLGELGSLLPQQRGCRRVCPIP